MLPCLLPTPLLVSFRFHNCSQRVGLYNGVPLKGVVSHGLQLYMVNILNSMANLFANKATTTTANSCPLQGKYY